MEDATKPQHPMRRQGTYYFRRSVPNERRPIIGKFDFKNSLGTADLDVAKRRLAEKVLWSEEVFEEARKKLGTSELGLGDLTSEDAKQLALDWFDRADRELIDEDFMRRDPASRAREISRAETAETYLQAPEADAIPDEVYWTANQILLDAGWSSRDTTTRWSGNKQSIVDIDTNSEGFQALCEYARRVYPVSNRETDC